MSMDAFLGDGYFARTGGDFLCFGAGGSGKAMALHLINKIDPADRPKRFIVTNRSEGRLLGMKAMVESLETDIEFIYVDTADPRVNDMVMGSMPEGTMVVNATGMGSTCPALQLPTVGCSL